MTDKLKPCPFCGGGATIVICDDEGNLRDETYLENPYSGLGYFIIHDETQQKGDCPIARYVDEPQGKWIYETAEDAIKAWNTRAGEQE